MLNEEDPVHAAIPPGRTAGRTAARAAVAAADLNRPVPRRQGTRGARRGARPACRAAAGLPAAAAHSKSADHLPPPRHLLPGTAGPEGANRHVCPVTRPWRTRSGASWRGPVGQGLRERLKRGGPAFPVGAAGLGRDGRDELLPEWPPIARPRG